MGKHKQQLRQIEALFVPNRKGSIEFAGVVESRESEDCDIHRNRRGSGGSIVALSQKRDSLNGIGKRSSIDGQHETNGSHSSYRTRESVDRESTPATGDTYSWLMRRRSSTKSNDGNR